MVIIRFDAPEIINFIKGINQPPWHMQSIIKDILRAAHDFCYVKFCHIRRNVTVVAQNLAFFFGRIQEMIISWGSDFNPRLYSDTGPVLVI